MTLGSILSSDLGIPLCGRIVEFHLTRKTSSGPTKHRVKAMLIPVSESDRIASERAAVQYLRTRPEYKEQDRPGGGRYLPEIPPYVVSEEFSLKFLALALVDPERPQSAFVGSDPGEYDLFRQGINDRQIAWLRKEYDKLLDDEYPETMTRAQNEELKAEALGK